MRRTLLSAMMIPNQNSVVFHCKTTMWSCLSRTACSHVFSRTNSCSGTRFHSSSPENLRCRFDNLCCTFLLRHPESELPWHQSDLNLGQIWWLEHISKSYNIGLYVTRSGDVVLAHLAGGPIVIASFSAGLSILPWGNCKTYSTSCSWWILHVSKVWSLHSNHVNAVSKHVCGTPFFNKNIWSPKLNVSCSIIQTPLFG